MAELKDVLTPEGYEQFTSIRSDSKSWYENRILDDVANIRDALGIGDERGRLLDVGCGPGWLTVGMSFMTNLDFVCVDLSERAIERAKEYIHEFYRRDRVRAMRVDAHDLPFEDQSFDFVTTTSSIGFWHNPQRGIEELYRVLKPGGRIFIRGFDGNRYTDFWHTLAETGIPEYKIVRNERMFYILIWKDRVGGEEEDVVATCSASAWHNPQTGIEEALAPLAPGSVLYIDGFEMQNLDFWKTLRGMGLKDFQMVKLGSGSYIKIVKSA